jgi:hypothetical protein
MKVGFYDDKTHSMVAVELWKDGWANARYTGTMLAAMYQSGPHRMPSRWWCAWDYDSFSVFELEPDPQPRTKDFLDAIEALVRGEKPPHALASATKQPRHLDH